MLAAFVLTLGAGCAGHPAYFRGEVASLPDSSRVAVLPLVNFTRDVNAPDIVMNALIVELLATHRFQVVDPGVVDDVIQRQRIRLTDRLSLAALQDVGSALGADYVMVGSVNEFSMVRDTQVEIPMVSIALRLVACATGNIVWASTYSRRGDDTETMFTLGRVETLEELATLTAREMTKTLAPGSNPKRQETK